jgi:hypothetical protein
MAKKLGVSAKANSNNKVKLQHFTFIPNQNSTNNWIKFATGIHKARDKFIPRATSKFS